MGLGDFWNKLMGHDKAGRVEEQLQEDQAEQPAPVEDYEAMKDDVAAQEHVLGGEVSDSDE